MAVHRKWWFREVLGWYKSMWFVSGSPFRLVLRTPAKMCQQSSPNLRWLHWNWPVKTALMCFNDRVCCFNGLFHKLYPHFEHRKCPWFSLHFLQCKTLPRPKPLAICRFDGIIRYSCFRNGEQHWVGRNSHTQLNTRFSIYNFNHP